MLTVSLLVIFSCSSSREDLCSSDQGKGRMVTVLSLVLKEIIIEIYLGYFGYNVIFVFDSIKVV